MLKKASIAAICFIIACGCSKFSKIQKSDNLDLKYKEAVKYFEKKDYYHAGTLFEEMIPILKGQADAEKAQLYYAYCQYYQKQLVISAYYFKKYYETFPRSEKADEAYFMHCRSLFEDSPEFQLDQTNTYQAIDAIQQYLERFKGSIHLDESNQMIDKLNFKLESKAYSQAKLFYRMRDYRAAVVSFDNLAKDYPNSKFLEEAFFLKVDAQYNYAKISIENKKKDRLTSGIEYYYSFIDKFPESKYLGEAERIYAEIQHELAHLEQPHLKKKSFWDFI